MFSSRETQMFPLPDPGMSLGMICAASTAARAVHMVPYHLT